MTTEASLILVEVQTDAGLIGYGEIQSGPLPQICRFIEQFGEIIRGMDALAILKSGKSSWTDLASARWHWRSGWLATAAAARPAPTDHGGHRGNRYRTVGYQGKATNLPVYRLLGGSRRELFTYATGGYYVEGAPLTPVPRSWEVIVLTVRSFFERFR